MIEHTGSFIKGFLLASLMFALTVHFVWQPMVDRAQKQAKEALGMVSASQKRTTSCQRVTNWALLELYNAKGWDVPDELLQLRDELSAELGGWRCY